MYFVSIADLCAAARTPVMFLNMSKTKQDMLDCYGERNLVPIDLLKHIIFYTSNGVQPVFTCESEKEDKEGRLVCWFLKSETRQVYKKWKENRPVQTKRIMETNMKL